MGHWLATLAFVVFSSSKVASGIREADAAEMPSDSPEDGEGTMRVVTYNVNGLRQRISQFGSLLRLLDSFDADVVCFQVLSPRPIPCSID